MDTDGEVMVRGHSCVSLFRMHFYGSARHVNECYYLQYIYSYLRFILVSINSSGECEGRSSRVGIDVGSRVWAVAFPRKASRGKALRMFP